MDRKNTPQGKVVLEFASALVAGDFAKAHSLLTMSGKTEWPESALREEFLQMTGYGSGPPNHVEVMEVLEDWPTKERADIGWAYAAIAGPGYSEGVSVVVCSEEGKQHIREIEWGRP